MSHPKIRLEEQIASEQQIHSHLRSCDDQFDPRLSLRVDLAEYSKKIFEKARTFEAFQGTQLVGLIAMYLDETALPKAYITNVSVLAEFSGKQIATMLLSSCLSHAKTRGAQSVALEVQLDNRVAIRMYQKFGFEKAGMSGTSLSMKLDLSSGQRKNEAPRV